MHKPAAPNMDSAPGDAVTVDGRPRVVTSAVRTTYRGARGVLVAHVAPGDVDNPTAIANAAVTRVHAARPADPAAWPL